MAQPDPAISRWCTEFLGAQAVEEFFAAQSMSSVHGLTLQDGRRVALKVRAAAPRLEACLAAQHAAIDAGIAAPKPLVGPVPFGTDGLVACAEEWLDDGVPQPPIEAPEHFGSLGAALVLAFDRLDPADFAPPPPWFDVAHGDDSRLWPPAASARWDPHAIDLPAWLPAFATRARTRLLAADALALPLAVGHADLNGLNTRWVATQGETWTPIVHDWDSIAGLPAALLAGGLAMDYLADGGGGIASVEQGERVLTAFAAGLGRPWSSTELEVAWAAGTWVACYNAAFEYLHGGPGAVCVQLEHDGHDRLRRAGA